MPAKMNIIKIDKSFYGDIPHEVMEGIAKMPESERERATLWQFREWLKKKGRIKEAVALSSFLLKTNTRPARGKFSGLTKSELAKSGTVETDWFI